MRVAMEPLTVAAGVDVFFYGKSPLEVYLSPSPASDLGLLPACMSEHPDSTRCCSRLAVSLMLSMSSLW